MHCNMNRCILCVLKPGFTHAGSHIYNLYIATYVCSCMTHTYSICMLLLYYRVRIDDEHN